MSADKTNVEKPDKIQNGDDVSYGDCEGPNPMYIKLVSSDDHEFIIKRENAILSGTIRAMLTGPGTFAENETNVIHFKEINSLVLQKICDYLNYKKYYTDRPADVPIFPIPTEIVVDLMLAAHFLDC